MFAYPLFPVAISIFVLGIYGAGLFAVIYFAVRLAIRHEKAT